MGLETRIFRAADECSTYWAIPSLDEERDLEIKKFFNRSILTKDMNGDGLTDIVLGAPGAGVTGNVTGMVFILLGKVALQYCH